MDLFCTMLDNARIGRREPMCKGWKTAAQKFVSLCCKELTDDGSIGRIAASIKIL